MAAVDSLNKTISIFHGVFAVVCTGKKINNKGVFSFSPELLQRFARGLVHIAFLQNLTLPAINMKANLRASFLKSLKQNYSV